MATLTWDQVGDRAYQTGVDRGVLYLPDVAVAWNGITSIVENFSHERRTYYLDGIKFLEQVAPGDFSAQLSAYTYPDEFDRVIGIASDGGGLFVHDQMPTNFGLSYRTLLGDDVSPDRGYKLHILYDLTAIPDSRTFDSIGAQPTPMTFSWNLSGIPVVVPGYRPTTHLSLDTTQMEDGLIEALEEILYGTDSTDPRLPSFEELVNFVESYWNVHVVDNGDGTWTATAPDQFITMLDSTTFQITDNDVMLLDEDTYQITSPDL